MSDYCEKFVENVTGKFYVIKTCIGCTLCSVIAPYNFMENTDEELAVMWEDIRDEVSSNLKKLLRSIDLPTG